MRFFFAVLFVLPAVMLRSSIPSAIERIDANTNRVSAGRLNAGVLRVDLEARLGRWYPEAEDGASEIVQAFGEVGHRLQVPGPMIRVRVGTQIDVTIHNRLSGSTLVVYGLHTRPGSPDDTIQVLPGAMRHVQFAAGTPGTYFYWASTTGRPIELRDSIDSQLSGAIVVDSVGARGAGGDRVFVIGLWHLPADSAGPKPWVPRDQMVINGKSWPRTERFTYATGDTVRWRWVNPSTDAHPMHLHGFYYMVATHGTWSGDTLYAPAERRQVVTEMLLPGQTMSTVWVPRTAGNWLMHCHFAVHASHFMSLAKVPDPVDPGAPDAVDHTVHGMAGLVLGIQVRGPNRGIDGALLAPSRAVDAPRAIRLLIQAARARYDTSPGYGFVVQDQPRTIPLDSVPELSPTLVLRRGQPVRITVVNHVRAPSSVHWHGIELADSYFDGVPGWSGTTNHLAPLIAPRDSFVARFTPPRAGTFMYHSHSNEVHQIASGMYGALVVLDSGQRFDSTTDRVFVVGGNGPGFEKGRVNGRREPAEQTLVAGTTYRFRIVQINPDWRVFVSLKADSVVQEWRAVAKDGADLPSGQAVVKPARILMGPGETSDFMVIPRAAGRMELEVSTQLDGWRVIVPLRVVPKP